MKDLILKLSDDYIKENDLIVRTDYHNPKWYRITFLYRESPHLYSLKLDVDEYRNSTVIYINNKRYVFSNDKFEEEFTKLINNLDYKRLQ